MRPVSSRRVISLRLHRSALDHARRLARSRGTSVSRVIEDAIDATHEAAAVHPSPVDRMAIAERLLGSLRTDGAATEADLDAREARIQYVEMKHR